MSITTISQDHKEAGTSYPIMQLLKDRWSPRTFSETEPTDTELRQLFEAVRWAASSMNEQPWRFIITRKGTEAYQKAFDCLSDFNQKWVDSPVLILAGYKKKFDSGKENFHALHDLGLAVGNLSVQAQEMGIALHQMAGLDWKKAHQVFNVPKDDYHLATAIALGFYGGDVSSLNADLAKQEKAVRNRKEQEDFVFSQDWGKSY